MSRIASVSFGMPACALAITMAIAAASTMAAHAEPLALVGARVLVKPGVVVERATVLVDNGVIVAVSDKLAVPAGATTIDASGGVITPGFIDSFSLVGLNEIDLEEESSDGSFSPTRTPVRVTYRAADAIDPFSMMRAAVRAAGLTSTVAAPRGVLLAGQSAWSSMAQEARLPLLGVAAIHGDLGPESTADKSRGGGIALLRDILTEARLWIGNKAQYERSPRDKALLSLAELRVLEPLLTRQVPLVLRAHAVSDIRGAIALAREFDIRLTIAGGTEAWLVADELAAARVAVILDPQNILPGRIEAPRVLVDAPARLRAAGVEIAFATFDAPPTSVGLRQLAGIAVANGLSYDDAIAALTSVPASIYRGAATAGKPASLPSGTLEAGARADLVLWSGDPFELSSWAKTVIVGGAVQSTDTRQQELFRRYR